MKPLPVIGSELSTAATPRAFEQAQLEWCRSLGDESQVENCYRVANPRFPSSPWANCVLSFAPLSVASIADDFAEVVGGSRMVSVSSSTSQLVQYGVETFLIKAGWTPRPFKLLSLGRLQRQAGLAKAISVLPARSAMQQYEQLLLQSDSTEPELRLLHLDDARYEPTVAMLGREPVGMIGLQSIGLTGVIRDLFVVPAHRQIGIGKALLSHALQGSARSGHKLILTSVESEPGLFTKAGFEPIGMWTAYVLQPAAV